MSAQMIFDTAPLGAIIRFSDGTPRPPDRFKRKLAQWENRNDQGRLIAKQPPSASGTFHYTGGFGLHIGDFGANGITLVRFMRSFQLTSGLTFEIVELPPVGSVRILRQAGRAEELEYLAPDAAAADAWVARNRLAKVRLEYVRDPVEEKAA